MNDFDSVIGMMPEPLLRCLSREEYLRGLLDHHYLEPWRHYHNYQHITDCLEILRTSGKTYIVELGAAIIFHDVIYDPNTTSNEEESAELALTYGPMCFARKSMGNIHWPLVKKLIMATKHTAKETDPLLQYMCDIDLHVFGQTFQHFARMGDQVINEYSAHFPRPDVVSGRKHFMAEWATSRPTIIYLDTRANEIAHDNIAKEIERLSI